MKACLAALTLLMFFLGPPLIPLSLAILALAAAEPLTKAALFLIDALAFAAAALCADVAIL